MRRQTPYTSGPYRSTSTANAASSRSWKKRANSWSSFRPAKSLCLLAPRGGLATAAPLNMTQPPSRGYLSLILPPEADFNAGNRKNLQIEFRPLTTHLDGQRVV